MILISEHSEGESLLRGALLGLAPAASCPGVNSSFTEEWVGQVSGNLRGDFPWPGLPCRPSDELEMMDFLSMESEATQVYTIH